MITAKSVLINVSDKLSEKVHLILLNGLMKNMLMGYYPLGKKIGQFGSVMKKTTKKKKGIEINGRD